MPRRKDLTIDESEPEIESKGALKSMETEMHQDGHLRSLQQVNLHIKNSQIFKPKV